MSTDDRWDFRALWLCALGAVLGGAAGLIAQVLTRLIGGVTNLAFYGRLSTSFASPAQNHLGLAVVAVPVIGALVVGLMARYGSKAIRGHGIPEAMEQVLTNESRIPARITWLKPLSAAIAIGTGGPFGAEGPIIATGGALGSLLGQLLPATADERKTLLAAGAAAGMAATFGSPVSAVLLAVELLLFEFRARSLIPVAIACATAAGIRLSAVGAAPVFHLPDLAPPSSGALVAYAVIGALAGLASVFITRLVYAVEDGFEHLPIHWMWWPALGALVVGVVGYFSPHTLGVGYDNIDQILMGEWVGRALLMFCLLKFCSWVVALGSGTSGGTLAPLFTIGGGLGFLLGTVAQTLAPGLGVDARVAALVGMAALFTGASRAFLASMVFAFETTRQPSGLLPLLAGCACAHLVSLMAMRNSIMTEKLARRGARVPSDYHADTLHHTLVRDHASTLVVHVAANQRVSAVRAWLDTLRERVPHHGFPVLGEQGELVGVVTRRDLEQPGQEQDVRVSELVRREPVVVFEDSSLREAADLMALEAVGRLPVVSREAPGRLVGILTRSDLINAARPRLVSGRQPTVDLKLRDLWSARVSPNSVSPSRAPSG
jgi:H+/Cl- antiporter ClcA/CBS domain-containing protein